jgi:hypothetical protein
VVERVVPALAVKRGVDQTVEHLPYAVIIECAQRPVRITDAVGSLFVTFATRLESSLLRSRILFRSQSLRRRSQSKFDLEPFGECGVKVQADATVSGNVIEGAPWVGILVGWGPSNSASQNS